MSEVGASPAAAAGSAAPDSAYLALSGGALGATALEALLSLLIGFGVRGHLHASDALIVVVANSVAAAATIVVLLARSARWSVAGGGLLAAASPVLGFVVAANADRMASGVAPAIVPGSLLAGGPEWLSGAFFVALAGVALLRLSIWTLHAAIVASPEQIGGEGLGVAALFPLGGLVLIAAAIWAEVASPGWGPSVITLAVMVVGVPFLGFVIAALDAVAFDLSRDAVLRLVGKRAAPEPPAPPEPPAA